MENYLVVITTILVITQIIRITQNAIQLRRQNRLIQEELDEIGEVTSEDIRMKRKIDKLLVELLPKIATKYDENN